MARRGEREYDEFTNSGADANRLSDADYAAMGENKNAFETAQKAGNQEGMNAAHDAAEALRKKYGYSGGADGGGYAPVARKDTPEFSYQNAPAYASKYQAQIDGALQMLLNREKFSYDYTKDPKYKQYEQAYTENGKRAMEDTLGQVSARTGGLASSYAGSASQQSYNGYMSALSAKIPELEQLAYSMYRDEGNDQKANIELLSALESGDFNKYQQILSQYNNDRNFSYGAFSDRNNWERDAEQTDYNRGRDEVSDQRDEDETAYGREQDAYEKAEKQRQNEALLEQSRLEAQENGDAEAFQRAIDLWKMTGTVDAQSAAILGLPAGTRSADYEAKLGAASRKSGGGGSSGGGTGVDDYKPYKPKLSAAQVSAALKNGITSESVLADYEYWFDTPYTQKYGAENAAATSDFNKLKSKIMGFRSSAGQADQISRAVEDKKISEEQAVELFRYFKIPLE